MRARSTWPRSASLVTRREQLLPKLVRRAELLEELAIFDGEHRGVPVDRKLQLKFSSLAGAASRFDLPAVVMDDEVTRHETDAMFAGTVTARIEGIENGAQYFFRQ